MSDTEVDLFKGREPVDRFAEDDGWLPRIALDHDGGHEMYVIVGEEVSGMVEDVPVKAWEKIRERLSRCPELDEGCRAIVVLVRDYMPGVITAGDVKVAMDDLVEGHHAGRVTAVYVPTSGS
jgi:hypothetical protein